MNGSGLPSGAPRVPRSSDDPRSLTADTHSATTKVSAPSGPGGVQVTPELVLVDPELAEAQRQTTERKAAMSSTDANEMYSVDRSQTAPAPAQDVAPTTPPTPAPEAAPAPSTPPNPPPQMVDVPLGTLIFRAGLLAEDQLEDALQEGMRTGKRLGEVLLERGWLNERDLGRMLAGQKGLPFVEVSAADVEPRALEALLEEKARRQGALPLRYEDGLLVIALADPSNELVLESLRRDFGPGFRLVVAPHGQLHRAIDEAYARLVSQPQPLLVADPAPPAQPEPPVEAHPEPRPEPELAAQSELPVQPEPPVEAQLEQPEPLLEFSPAADDEPDPQPEPAPEAQASADEGPEPTHQPFAGSTPKLLSRMLFPSVRHAAHDEVAAEAQEMPAPEEDLAQLEVTAVPEVPVPSSRQQPAETGAAPSPAERAEPADEAQPAPASASVAAEPAEAQEETAPQPPTEQPEPQPADEATPSAHHVLVRLRDGELLHVGQFQTEAEASAKAQEAVGEIASAESDATWPFFAGRYLRPDSIVSVDLLEESPDA
jgi:hypothetical protein